MMRIARITALLTAALLTLSACQLFSGLDRLEVRDAGNKAEPNATRTQGVTMDASMPMHDGKPVDHNGPPITSEQTDAQVNIARNAPDAGARDAGEGNTPQKMRPTSDNGGSPSPAQAQGGSLADEPLAGGAAAPMDAGMAPDAAMVMQCVPPPAGGPACTAAPQCGCDKTANCAVVSDQLACVTAGKVGENQACRDVANCAIGYQCIDGACLKLCDSAHPDCKGGAKCIQMQSSKSMPIAGASFCESNCNLADPTHADGDLSACGAGLVCGWNGTGARCAQSQRAQHRHGESCKDVLDCASGYTCVSDSQTCAKWCRTASDCPSDFTCNTGAPVMVGTQAFGTCKPNCLDRTEQVCGLTTQCGCDEAHSCAATTLGLGRVTHVCRDVGPVGKFQSCQYAEDCIRGTSCVDSNCQPNCLTEIDCERYASCDFSYFEEAPLIPAVSTCTRPCDPADPHRVHAGYGSCPSNRACEVTADGYSYCRSASLRGAVGTSCSSNTDCASGNTCSSANYCVQLCRNDSDCSAGTCRAFATAQHAREVEWGYCEVATESMPAYSPLTTSNRR